MTNQSDCAYLLLDLAEDSSDESFALPLPFTSVSRVRLCLEAGEERIAREETESTGRDDADEDACSAASRSLPLSFSSSFCFAALTLALERKALDSGNEVEWSMEDCCWTCRVREGCEDELEVLLVAC